MPLPTRKRSPLRRTDCRMTAHQCESARLLAEVVTNFVDAPRIRHGTGSRKRSPDERCRYVAAGRRKQNGLDPEKAHHDDRNGGRNALPGSPALTFLAFVSREGSPIDVSGLFSRAVFPKSLTLDALFFPERLTKADFDRRSTPKTRV